LKNNFDHNGFFQLGVGNEIRFLIRSSQEAGGVCYSNRHYCPLITRLLWLVRYRNWQGDTEPKVSFFIKCRSSIVYSLYYPHQLCHEWILMWSFYIDCRSILFSVAAEIVLHRNGIFRIGKFTPSIYSQMLILKRPLMSIYLAKFNVSN
jgi:hypothetical protein